MISIGFTFGLAIYGIIWFLTLFMVLPFGIRTQADENDVEPGSDSGAPAVPQMWRRFIITSVLSLVLYAGVYWVLTSPEALPWFKDLGASVTNTPSQ